MPRTTESAGVGVPAPTRAARQHGPGTNEKPGPHGPGFCRCGAYLALTRAPTSAPRTVILIG